MARVFVDTSAIYALLDADDARHADARLGFERLKAARAEPIVSNFVVAESHSLLLARLGPDVARQWLLGNIWAIERVTEQDEARAVDIISGYRDKTFSYTDACSFALMERLRVRRALAFDRHFDQFGVEKF